MSVGCLANEKIIVNLKENIARPTKVKKTTVKLKIVVGTAWVNKIKKTWMIHLQQRCRHGV